MEQSSPEHCSDDKGIPEELYGANATEIRSDAAEVQDDAQESGMTEHLSSLIHESIHESPEEEKRNTNKILLEFTARLHWIVCCRFPHLYWA